jgi:hypothetical protein
MRKRFLIATSFLVFAAVILLVPIESHAAECRPGEEVKVVNAKIAKVDVADASKFPSHHPDVYYSTNFHVAQPGCAGIPVIVREIEPLAPKCRVGQTINGTGAYMQYLVDKTIVYVAFYPREFDCR